MWWSGVPLLSGRSDATPPPTAIPPPSRGEGSLGPKSIGNNTKRQRRQRKFLQGAAGAEADLHCDTIVQFCGAIPSGATLHLHVWAGGSCCFGRGGSALLCRMGPCFISAGRGTALRDSHSKSIYRSARARRQTSQGQHRGFWAFSGLPGDLLLQQVAPLACSSFACVGGPHC